MHKVPVASTYLKGDASNTKDGLRNWVQLRRVNVWFVSHVDVGGTDPCEDGPIFNCPIHELLYRFAQQWGILLQQSFEFMER